MGDGIEMMEDGSRTHEFSTPRRMNIKNSKKTSQSFAVQLAVGCLKDGTYCYNGASASDGCSLCCNDVLFDDKIAYCGKKGQKPGCWGTNTICPPFGCGNCCNSWSFCWFIGA